MRLFAGAGWVVLLMCGSFGQAAVVQYADRSAWRTASGGGTGDIVDAMDTGTFTRDAFSVTAGGSGALNAQPNFNLQTSVDGTGYLRLLLNNTGNSVTFTFNAPVTAFGYDLNPQGFNLGVAVNFVINGTTTGSYALPSTDVNAFQGFVSDTPFTTLTLSTTASTAWHGVDNVEAFSSVPEARDAALASGIGLLVYGIWRRRGRV